MKLADNKNETEIIKLAVEGYGITGHSPSRLLLEASEWLMDAYEKLGDKSYVEASQCIMQAYMELGLSYEKGKDLFDKILQERDISKQEIFPKNKYYECKIKATPSQIRSVLGRWAKSNGKEANAEWTAKDIADRVQNRRLGQQFYKKAGSETGFELIVLEEDAFLLDLEKKKIFTFYNNEDK